MASLSRENDTDPVMRGRFVRETVLCQPPPPPPPTVNAVPPPPDGKNTQRERLASHSKDPSCAGCHALLDPLGLAFESYDGIGKYRAMDVGKPIDTSGKLTSARPENAPWKNAVELVGILANSPDAQACLASKAFEWGQGREVSPADACALSAIAKRFEVSGGNLLDLAVAIASDESFFTRQTP